MIRASLNAVHLRLWSCYAEGPLTRAAAMAGTLAGLPAGIRLSDHISLGVIARTFPIEQVRQVLAETGKASERERDLPAHVMVYYAIALALYMARAPGRCCAACWRGCAGSGARGGQGGGQERHLAGAHPPGRGAAAPAVRAGGAAGGDARHQGRLVPASGGWSAWTAPAWMWPTPRRTAPPSGARGQPWRERLPAGPLRGAGRERHARAVRRAPGPLRGGRDHAGP